MLRPAFKRESLACILSTYCSPVATVAGVWSVQTTRRSRAV